MLEDLGDGRQMNDVVSDFGRRGSRFSFGFILFPRFPGSALVI